MFTKILACSRLLLAAVFCFSFAPAAYADNVVITDGSATYTRFLNASLRFRFDGADFLVTGSADTIDNAIVGGCLIGPCTSGTLSSIFSGHGIGGQGEYQGIPFRLSITGTPGTADASFFLNSVTYVIPDELRDASQILITAPFTLNAFVGGPGIDLRLSGQGTVYATLQRLSFVPNGAFRVDDLRYVIGNSPSGTTIIAVPEPTTIMLLATGLFAFGMWKRRARAVS